MMKKPRYLLKTLILLIAIFFGAMFYNALDFAFSGHSVKTVALDTYLTKDVTASIRFYDVKEGSYTIYTYTLEETGEIVTDSFTYSFVYSIKENYGLVEIDFNRGDKNPISFYIIKNGLLETKSNKFFYKI